MFKKNNSHAQLDIFSVNTQLNINQQKLWDKSKEHCFYINVFSKIDESLFACLFSSKKSRPNTPVNQLVGALILKHLYNWSYSELFTHLNFNLLTRHAIGIHSLNTKVFCEASIFNFQNKLIEHFDQTGDDLVEKVFQQLTLEQIQVLNVDTSVQRGDSFLVGSNIRDYSRLELLIEVLRRIIRILSSSDLDKLDDILKPYKDIKASSYLYKVEKDNLDSEYEQIGNVYHKVLKAIENQYVGHLEYTHFLRVYKEHFAIEDQSVKVKPSKDLNSTILMSPDDEQATYRLKRKEESKGFVTHLSETSNPNNEVNLITDVCVYPNNIGDAQILEERLPVMVERTPQINEYFVDGQYGSPGVDKQVEKFNITMYQKLSRGKKSKGGLKISQTESSNPRVSCKGGQDIKAIQSTRNKKRWKAEFNASICERCPFKNECKIGLIDGKTSRRKKLYYFGEERIKIHKRLANFSRLEKPKIYTRANVEATVKEAKRGMKNKKVRVRTRIRVSIHMVFTVLGINLTRIHKRLALFLVKLTETLTDPLNSKSQFFSFSTY